MRDEVVWLGTTETARRIGVTLRTVYRLIDDGALVAYRVGRVIRVMESDLAAYIVSARVVPGSLSGLHGGDEAGDHFLVAYEEAANGVGHDN